jgi:mRNA interferase MazF
MPSPGDVIIADIPGAQGIKRRPALVISSASYHSHRPDLIAGVITSNIAATGTPSDCILQDWQAAGLDRPSAFRTYLITMESRSCRVIGHLSTSDWNSVQAAYEIRLI